MAFTEAFEKLVKLAMANEKLSGSDYTDENGILRCGECGEPKRRSIICCGKSYTIPAACSCVQEREQERQAKERAGQLEKRRTTAFAEPCLRKVFFSADDAPDSYASRAAREFAESFERDKNQWLLFFGPCGTGKTFLAACIANAVIDRGFSVLFTSISEIESDLWAAKDKSEVYGRLKRFDLLVIDDLCAERNTPYMNEIAFNVIDGRYRACKSTVVTTNLTGEQLMSQDITDRGRIYSRLCQYSRAIMMNGDDRRQQALLTRR